jgi:hypothetical protein
VFGTEPSTEFDSMILGGVCSLFSDAWASWVPWSENESPSLAPLESVLSVSSACIGELCLILLIQIAYMAPMRRALSLWVRSEVRFGALFHDEIQSTFIDDIRTLLLTISILTNVTFVKQSAFWTLSVPQAQFRAKTSLLLCPSALETLCCRYVLKTYHFT